MLGSRLGPYELQEEIGTGGMATVFRAYQASVDRYVAVKVIHKNIASDEIALERFRREARLIARLEHPHILPIHDFDGSNDPPYIVMRYMDSGTLKDVLTRHQLPLNEIGYLMRQVATAIDYAHEQGIVHRDIKPSNIMLDKLGNVMVSDFGIARLVDSKQHGDVTGTGGVVGTPGYMSPEQVMSHTEIDGRADVYALGVTLFELLTGKMPFSDESAIRVMMKQIQEVPPRVTLLNPALPSALDDVVFTALAKEPNERFATAGALAIAAVKALGGTVLDSPPVLSHAAQQTAAGFRPTTDSKSTPSEQNKIVTVLFASAVDYGEMLAEKKGAETARRALQALRERMEKIVVKHEGQLVEHSERDWLAIWGAATTHEDQAERAVRAALDMQNAVRELSAGVIAESDDETLPLKIGVNTGLALLIPSEKKDFFTASGIALTLAQKLADAADGLILISPDTYHDVQGVFDVLEDIPIKVRGRKDPLPTYRVVAAKARAFRIPTHNVAGVETKMVGREAELKQLQNAYLDAFEETETQVATVLSESGLGKSRLLAEFGKWADLRPETWRSFQGRATPAMTQRPYALWREVLSFRFEILDDDPLSIVKQKMETGVETLLRQPDPEMAHLMGYLAGFDFSDSPHIRGLLGDPKQLTTRARQLAFRFFERLSNIEPAILELEDIHYADDASLDLFTELPAAHPGLSLLIIHLARPTLLERRPAWGNAQSFHKRLTLMPLDKRESRDLARDLLQKAPDPSKSLRDLLVERAEGNPLFMEELVRLLVEDRVILVEGENWRVEESRLANVRVPPSLIGVMQARVDTLLHVEKLTLQRAAAFGRVFHDTLLRATDMADDVHVGDLQNTLKTLEVRGFIQRRETSSFAGSIEYAFTQGLLREMLYVTLLERQRLTYHSACATWLAQSERAEEYLPLIAEHYEKAEDLVHAAKYLERAGDKAMLVSGFAEAVHFYNRVHSPMAILFVKLADAYSNLGNFPAARAAIDQAQTAAQTDADRAAALALLGEISSELGDYAEAQTILSEAVPLARASGDPLTLCLALYALGDVHWRLGKLDEARVALDESLALALALGDITRELFALNRLGGLYMQINVAEAERLYTEVGKRAVAVGNRERAMAALNNLSEVAKDRKDYILARDNNQQALAIAQEIGMHLAEAALSINLGDVDTQLGKLHIARTELRDGLALTLRLGALPWVVWGVLYFAKLVYAEGQPERALQLIGLARCQPAWGSDHQHDLNMIIAEWALDASIVGAALAKGADLNWEKTIEELLE